jgi:hypothetical protein
MKRTLILSIIAVVIIAGGWYLTWGQPLMTRIVAIDADISVEEKKLTAYREALMRFDERIKEYNRLHTKINDNPVIFSGRDEVVTLYHALDSLCHQPGYKLEEITPSLEEVIQFLREWAQSDSLISIPLRIKIRATYRSLAQLVMAIEESRYFSHLTFCRLYGSDEMYPYCALDVAFMAGLSNRQEMFGFE